MLDTGQAGLHSHSRLVRKSAPCLLISYLLVFISCLTTANQASFFQGDWNENVVERFGWYFVAGVCAFLIGLMLTLGGCLPSPALLSCPAAILDKRKENHELKRRVANLKQPK